MEGGLGQKGTMPGGGGGDSQGTPAGLQTTGARQAGDRLGGIIPEGLRPPGLDNLGGEGGGGGGTPGMPPIPGPPPAAVSKAKKKAANAPKGPTAIVRSAD